MVIQGARQVGESSRARRAPTRHQMATAIGVLPRTIVSISTVAGSAAGSGVGWWFGSLWSSAPATDGRRLSDAA